MRRRDDLLVFGMVAGFFLLVFFRLLTVGYFRPDDLGRTLVGYYNWSDDGRPLTTLLMRLLAFDFSLTRNADTLVDDAPLPQFLAIGAMGLSGIMLRRAFPALTPMRAAAVAILVFATPFVLEPFSYIFDSLSVVASMVLGLAASLLLNRIPARGWEFAAGVASLVASLLFYQTGLNVFLAFFAVLVLRRIAVGTAGVAVWRNLGAVLGAAVIYLVLLAVLRATGLGVFSDYQIVHSRLLPLRHALGGLLANLHLMGGFVASVIQPRSLYGLLTVLLLAMAAVFTLRPLRFRLSALVLFAAGFVGLLLSVAGPLLLLAEPIVAPRVFCGFGGMLGAACLCAFLSARTRGEARIVSLLACGLMACFARYGFVYGAMARDFDRYETFAVPTIAAEIDRMAETTGLSHLAILGSLPYPASVRHVYAVFPGMRPIPVNQTGIAWFSQALLLRYGLDPALTTVQGDPARACRGDRHTVDGHVVWHDAGTIYLVFSGACG